MTKQPYIEERTGKKGVSYRVKLKGHNKTFNECDYLDPKLAYKKAIQFRDSILYGDINPYQNKKITIDELYQQVFDVFPVRCETRRKLDIMYRKYINNKEMDIQDLKADDVLRDLNAMVEITTNDTIQRVFSIYRKIINVAIYKEYVSKDVSVFIKCPKSHTNNKFKVNKVIDRQIVIDMEKFVRKSFKSHYEKVVIPELIEFLYLTGMRICEALALTRDDIKKNHIEIRKEIGSSMERRLVVRPCKTELSSRDIPLTQDMKSCLKRVYEINSNDVIFSNEDGSYIDSTILGDRLHQLGKSKGIDFNLYSIRHLVATELTRANVDERTRIEIFGHSNIATTLGYARSDDDLKISALKEKSSQKVPKSV